MAPATSDDGTGILAGAPSLGDKTLLTVSKANNWNRRSLQGRETQEEEGILQDNPVKLKYKHILIFSIF